MDEAPAIGQTEKPVTTDIGLSVVDLSLKCPECSSKRLYRDGLRYLADGQTVQRYLCRDCGLRFSWPKAERQHGSKNLKTHEGHNEKCRVGAEGYRSQAKNSAAKAIALAEVDGKTTSGLNAGATSVTTDKADVKGKLVEFMWWLKRNGKTESTIQTRTSVLKLLAEKGVDLLNPEKVKEAIATYECSTGTKRVMVDAYKSFAKYMNIPWEPPNYKPMQKIPFIPLEREIDDLIACSSKRTAALLQILKETGARLSEALELKWTDIDSERKVVRIEAEKGSNSRILKISDKLLNMLSKLPKEDIKIFGGKAKKNSYIESLRKARKKAAFKLQNPRLLQIHYHILRHWKGTMEYHKTKDPWHVKRVLGHKSLKSTEIYINIEQAIFENAPEEFHVKVAQTPEEIKALLEVGFEYVCIKDGLMFFRKRK
ncbi:tyrosine-type recombinase/integrase [Candidatus Bathyarchaeota archaeon]|nr:tyrosine-type recombinase/integrase [Candidatus Bathyarchaeota archaeon]